MFGVPVTFETSAVDSETKKRTDGTYLSFYDEEPSTSMPYSSTLYGTQDLIEGDVVDGDCLKTDKPCSLLIPEGEIFCIYLLAFTFILFRVTDSLCNSKFDHSLGRAYKSGNAGRAK